LRFPATASLTWASIPTAYVHKVRVQHGGIDTTLNIPNIAGKKLSLIYDAGLSALAGSALTYSDESTPGAIELPDTAVPVETTTPRGTIVLQPDLTPKTDEPGEEEFTTFATIVGSPINWGVIPQGSLPAQWDNMLTSTNVNQDTHSTT
jgi:hypothetical protein